MHVHLKHRAVHYHSFALPAPLLYFIAALTHAMLRCEFEHIVKDPTDGELCLRRTNLKETLMEVRIDTDVQIVRHVWV